MRAEKSVKNANYAVVFQIVNIVIKFILQTVFIKTLGKDYLGVNGLFSNILTMLSLAELGVGATITYHLYKPLAENNIKKTSSLMQFFKTAYIVIGLIILVAGLALTPFLNVLIKNPPNVPSLVLIYWLFLCNSVISYFYTYKRSLIIADQNAYLDSKNLLYKSIIQTALQCFVLIVFKNYILFLLIQILATFLSNVFISKTADKMYPYLKEKAMPLPKDEKKSIFKDVYAMMAHKVGGVLVSGTDNLLLSSFIGIQEVGIYSNYVLITSALKCLLSPIFTALTASVGNLNACEKSDAAFKIYNSILLLNFWLYGFSAIGLYICLNPFITMWAGKSYLLSVPIVFMIVLNYYVTGVRQTSTIFKDTQGLFWNDRFKPYFEAGINLAASIILLKIYGFIGVLLGTFISTMTTSFWVEPYILYKHGFHKPVWRYFVRYFLYTAIVIITGCLTVYICSFIVVGGWHGLIYKALICCIIPNIIFFVCAFRTKEFQRLVVTGNRVLSQHGITFLGHFIRNKED